MKRKHTINKQVNSNTHNDNDNGEHKTGASEVDIPGLPFDIIADIMSRLPLKLIIGCKFHSKTLSYIISGPSFSNVYLTNKSNSFFTINLDASKPHRSLDLIEFDQKDFCKIKKVGIFNTERLPDGSSSSSCNLFSICGYSNGLICLLKRKLSLHKLFVINPILGEVIQLPKPVYDNKNSILFSYGLGYCQLRNRYKVLRVITEHVEGRTWKINSEIFTIGYDQTWRSVVNAPYNIKGTVDQIWRSVHRQPNMVSLLSALHWIVQPVPLSRSITLKLNWKDRICICAFDITEEKVSALQLPQEVPQEVEGFPPCFPRLSVLSEKLCLFSKTELWVMDEYGVEGSWTKKLILKMESNFTLMPLTVSPEEVILLSDYHRVVWYDTRKETCLTGIHWSDHDSYPIPYVPNFVSLRNLIQHLGSITDVQPYPLVSETASAPLDHQLQQKMD